MSYIALNSEFYNVQYVPNLAMLNYNNLTILPTLVLYFVHDKVIQVCLAFDKD